MDKNKHKMKWIRICKCLCLLFVAICSILFSVFFAALAADADGSMAVTARIEATSDEVSQPVNSGSSYTVSSAVSSTAQDKSNVLTGDAASACVVIFLLLLIISSLVVCYCSKNESGKNSRSDSFK